MISRMSNRRNARLKDLLKICYMCNCVCNGDTGAFEDYCDYWFSVSAFDVGEWLIRCAETGLCGGGGGGGGPCKYSVEMLMVLEKHSEGKA